MLFRVLVIIFILLSNPVISSVPLGCNIYIHGIGKDTTYFNNKSRSISWNSNLPLKYASVNLAEKVLDEISSCDQDQPVFLHAHNYAVTVLYYILGQGKRFVKIFPNHDFVSLYKEVLAVYSYTGAFRGTPLMDMICSSGDFSNIKEYLGSNCILSLTTQQLYHPSQVVPSPGVPFYLIYSTRNRGLLSDILSNYRFNMIEDKISKNVNDGILLISSSMGCRSSEDIFDAKFNCLKINSTYIKDYLHIKMKNHYDVVQEVQ